MGGAFIDFAYKTGAGRYIQEPEAIGLLGAEVRRFGAKAFVIAGVCSYHAAGLLVEEALEAEGVPYELSVFTDPVSYEAAEDLAARALGAGCDVVVGVGGGRIMDAAKAVATTAGRPVIQVPTSVATCAAFTPLSVMYNPDGTARDIWRFEREVDAIVADGRVMAAQPPRLIAAGIMDSVAKVYEISHGSAGLDAESESIQRYCAYRYACVNNELVERYGVEAYRDAEERRFTEAVDRIVFLNLALTGVVSSLTRGYHQTALAHRFYDGLRTIYGKRLSSYLHGELVAIGLLMQVRYNGQPDQAQLLLEKMHAMDMPCSLPEIGITSKDSDLPKLRAFIAESEFISDDEGDLARFEEAFKATLG